jgi:uncharacterized membrane protein HdeD (DUF308 family)
MTSTEHPLAAAFAENWWVLLLRGIVAIAFGVLAWAQPGITIATLVIFFGAYVLVDGVFGIWMAIAGRKESQDWWVMLLWGLVSVGAGVLTFMAPGVTTVVLVLYVAAWAIATGVLQIVAAVRLRKEIDGEWMLILAGVASVLLGIVLMMQPGAGAVGLLWVIAAYAVFFGVLLVILSFKVRGLKR